MKELTKKLEKIANEKLGIESLEQRWSDDLDFHEVSAWSLKAALEAAYELGRQSK